MTRGLPKVDPKAFEDHRTLPKANVAARKAYQKGTQLMKMVLHENVGASDDGIGPNEIVILEATGKNTPSALNRCICLFSQVFSGNSDMGTIVSHTLTPRIIARYVRFSVLSWYGHISMRAELYGCALEA